MHYKHQAATRAAAARALGTLGDPRAVMPLIDALGRDSRDVCRAAGEALILLGAEALAPLLAAEAVLREKDEARFLSAASRLASGGQDETARTRLQEACLAALRADDSEVQEEAAQGLTRLGWQPAADSDTAAYRIALRQWDEAAQLGDAAVEELSRALTSRTADVRLAAARALGETATCCRTSSSRANLAHALAAALQDADDELAGALLTSLGRAACALEDAAARGRVVDLLIERLEHWRHTVRFAAASALLELFRHGGLDEASRERILAERERLSAPHTDRLLVDDYCRREAGTGWYHVDTATHDDHGIGVEL